MESGVSRGKFYRIGHNQAIAGKSTSEGTAGSGVAFDAELSTVTTQRMLDDGETQPDPAILATSTLVDAKKTAR